MFQLEKEITNWRNQLQLRNAIPEDSLRELEQHLRDEIQLLCRSGLSEEEALIVAIKRIGNTHSVAGEFSVEFGENIWRQLVLEPERSDTAASGIPNWIWMILLVACGGTLFHTARLLCGYSFGDNQAGKLLFLNLGLFAYPSIFIYFAARKRASRSIWLAGAFGFILSAVLVNLYPFTDPEHTLVLSATHLAIFLGLLCLVAYCGRSWRTSASRMSFIRASGEIFIYTVLILCGLGVFAAFVAFAFLAIGIKVDQFLTEYILIFGGFAAPAFASYLVCAKRSVVENFAPILARIFSPLFLVLLVGFLVSTVIMQKSISTDREYLIGFDLMLAFVIGMVVYSISARDPHERVGTHDFILWLLVLVTIVADLFALSGILARLGSYGLSANRVAALGENLILLGNLGILFLSLMQFIRKKLDFEIIELWQTRYLWIYFVWTGIVALIFPLCFDFK
jgi:hypothetical protein